MATISGRTAWGKASTVESSSRSVYLHLVEHWLNWTRHFGLASGSEAKIEQPTERYILAVFGYGCNLGPYQTARHTRGLINGQMLSRINRLHIQTSQIEAAMRELINAYN